MNYITWKLLIYKTADKFNISLTICGNTLSTHLYFNLYFNRVILGYLTVLLLSAFNLCILV